MHPNIKHKIKVVQLYEQKIIWKASSIFDICSDC